MLRRYVPKAHVMCAFAFFSKKQRITTLYNESKDTGTRDIKTHFNSRIKVLLMCGMIEKG